MVETLIDEEAKVELEAIALVQEEAVVVDPHLILKGIKMDIEEETMTATQEVAELLLTSLVQNLIKVIAVLEEQVQQDQDQAADSMLPLTGLIQDMEVRD